MHQLPKYEELFQKFAVVCQYLNRSRGKKRIYLLISIHYKRDITLVISLLNSSIVLETSGAFIRLLTSFITSALFDKCPTVRAMAEMR